MDTSHVIVFLFTDEDHDDVRSTIDMFTGTSSKGMTVELRILPVPHHKIWGR